MGLIRDVSAANDKPARSHFYIQKMCQSPKESLFLLSRGNAKPLRFTTQDSQYFKNMAQEVSDFLKGQDDKIIDELRDKMNKTAAAMEFERAAEYRDLIQAIGTLRTKRVMAKDLQNAMFLAIMWTRVGCAQVFFVRQGKTN